ncbi:hypothetical protein QJS10_CPB17g00367 [Acorus calamus]|uniref:Uncharacterized protein n=1 Tax=Acorus calamus TaxID=4465 RepID=A0AAV9CSD2_ACOCL|nr:hypothetical protein QJS10_CPB17g00367 [Acorus calamus]
MSTDRGTLSFSESIFSDTGVGGFQRRVLLRGLHMVWRTEGVLRKVVEPFVFLLDYVEILDCEEILLPAMATVWVLKDVWHPPSLLVVLGGLEVKVLVEVLLSPKVSSYADIVRCDHKIDAYRLPRDGRPVEGGARASEGLSKGTQVQVLGSEAGSVESSEESLSSPNLEGMDDMASSGPHQGGQSEINVVNSVPPIGMLVVGQITNGSLKRKVACTASDRGRLVSIRGRLGPPYDSSVSDGRGDGLRSERRKDVSSHIK